MKWIKKIYQFSPNFYNTPQHFIIWSSICFNELLVIKYKTQTYGQTVNLDYLKQRNACLGFISFPETVPEMIWQELQDNLYHTAYLVWFGIFVN